jgi:hypothetical protein
MLFVDLEALSDAGMFERLTFSRSSLVQKEPLLFYFWPNCRRLSRTYPRLSKRVLRAFAETFKTEDTCRKKHREKTKLNVDYNG